MGKGVGHIEILLGHDTYGIRFASCNININQTETTSIKILQISNELEKKARLLLPASCKLFR